jgi:hypothetical protein
MTFDNNAGFAWGTNWVHLLVPREDLARADLSRIVVTGRTRNGLSGGSRVCENGWRAIARAARGVIVATAVFVAPLIGSAAARDAMAMRIALATAAASAVGFDVALL